MVWISLLLDINGFSNRLAFRFVLKVIPPIEAVLPWVAELHDGSGREIGAVRLCRLVAFQGEVRQRPLAARGWIRMRCVTHRRDRSGLLRSLRKCVCPALGCSCLLPLKRGLYLAFLLLLRLNMEVIFLTA